MTAWLTLFLNSPSIAPKPRVPRTMVSQRSLRQHLIISGAGRLPITSV